MNLSPFSMKCYARLNRDWRSEIEAIIIAFVPAVTTTVRTVAGGSKLDTISTDAIVILNTFDKGRIYQVPLECVRVVGDWHKEDE